RRCWLWVAATATVAAFAVHARRGAAGLRALLGSAIVGIVTSDRWSAYSILPWAQRQLGWAHLKRGFRTGVERGGIAAQVGEAGLAVVEAVFEQWHLFRGGGISRGTLLARLDPVAAALHEVLEAGRACAPGKVATFCGNLLRAERALWTFVVEDGVEPTN